MGPNVASRSGDYEIHVKGRVNESFHFTFEELTISVKPNRNGALYGILDRIQALGLELVEIRRLPDDPVIKEGVDR